MCIIPPPWKEPLFQFFKEKLIVSLGETASFFGKNYQFQALKLAENSDFGSVGLVYVL